MSFNSGAGGGIANANDVALSNPAQNDFLGYNAGIAKWQNSSLAGKTALATGGGRETVWFNFAATGAITLDLSQGNVFRLTLTGNVTLSFTGATNNQACAISLYVKQDGNGGRTLTFPSTVKWPGGTQPTGSTGASTYDLWVFESITGGTDWFGSLVGANFS